MNKSKHIVITGASGFIGRHLMEDLKNTQHRITLISRHPEKLKHLVSLNVKVVEANLHNRESLVHAFNDADVLVNMAAELYNQNVIQQTNVEGTVNVIEAMKANRVLHLIHLSSVGVVGMQYRLKPVEVTESTACEPKNTYEKTKLASEQLLLEAEQQKAFSLCILRPTNVFGETHPKKALHSLFAQLKEKNLFISSKNAVANYVYVKDVSAAILHFVEHQEHTGIFNLGSSVPMYSFISFFRKLIPTPVKHFVLPNFVFAFFNLIGNSKVKALSNAVRYSDDKLKKVFTYPYGVEKGIERTMREY